MTQQQGTCPECGSPDLDWRMWPVAAAARARLPWGFAQEDEVDDYAEGFCCRNCGAGPFEHEELDPPADDEPPLAAQPPATDDSDSAKDPPIELADAADYDVRRLTDMGLLP